MALSEVTADPVVNRAERSDAIWRMWRAFRDWDRRHAIAVDAVIAIGLFLASSSWVLHIGFNSSAEGYAAGLTIPLLWRRRAPTAVFAVMAAVALAQWFTTGPLLADGALLVALFTVATEAPTAELVASAAVLEAGVILATVRWAVAGNHFKTFVFLSGMAFAATVAGIAVRELRRQMEWLAERGDRLEIERDQQASIAAAAERARIAREMHDVISHNLQVMVTLADAASVAQRTDPTRAAEAVTEISGTGRQALHDMRLMLGLLRQGEGTRTELATGAAALTPQPGLADLPALVERVKATGLDVELTQSGTAFDLSSSAGMTVYRIVQEGLTNTLKHAVSPHRVVISLLFDDPHVTVGVIDDGGPRAPGRSAAPPNVGGGHGLDGMSERAAAFGGLLTAGPHEGGGWSINATLRGGKAEGL
ncbi:MAG TPA: histidine kinase [Acidimicrobiales bacterium]|jgi:signal transduction histidine kinase|nr:histidine kinase [Acidimicrobiales bacterium]